MLVCYGFCSSLSPGWSVCRTDGFEGRPDRRRACGGYHAEDVAPLPPAPVEASMSESNQGREQTDESLRLERGKTDTELNRRREDIEQSADAVVVKARSDADQVLQDARDTADEGGAVPCTASVIEERARAD